MKQLKYTILAIFTVIFIAFFLSSCKDVNKPNNITETPTKIETPADTKTPTEMPIETSTTAPTYTPTEAPTETPASSRKKLTVSKQYCPTITGQFSETEMDWEILNGFYIKKCEDFQSFLDCESNFSLKMDTTGTWSWPGSIWSNPSLIFDERSVIIILKPAGDKTRYTLSKTEYDESGIYFTITPANETDEKSVLQGLYIILDKTYTDRPIFIEMQ